MSRELMPKSGIMMPHVVVNRDAAVVGVSTVDGVAGAIDLTGKYLQKTDASATYQTKTEGASKTYVLDSIQPIMEGALFKADPFVDNNVPFRSAGANGVESVDMMKVTTDNSIKIGSYASSVQGVEIHSAGRVQVVDQNDGGVETKYPIYSKRFRPEIEDLPFAAIGSYVKDSQGRTIGVNRTGINSDIKQFTQKVTFSEPVTVPDAVGDYDAVTLRQLRNSGGGSGGPTMSGISNFGIGDFHLRDSRAFIPAFEVTSDGQLLSRSEYPDLWAYAQLLTPISDADWLADPQKRGKYSTGDGSTTFRVPDRNGVQSGSIKELFGRGDGGSSSTAGTIYEAAAPDIGGAAAGVSQGTYAQIFGTAVRGAFFTDNGLYPQGAGETIPGGTGATEGRQNTLNFLASRSNATYGRYGVSDNILPRNFIGVWTIRAHGGFVAANTSWSVINGDTSMPPSGVSVDGGYIRSVYNVAGSPVAEFAVRAVANSNGYYARAYTRNHTDNTSGYFDFHENGEFAAAEFRGQRITLNDNNWPGVVMKPFSANPSALGGVTLIESNIGAAASDVSRVSLIRRRVDGVTGSITVGFPQTAGTLALQGTSGINFKKDIVDADANEALDRITNQRLVNFVYKDDEQERVRFGVIAEEAELIAPQYIKHNQESYEDILDEEGNKIGEKTRDRPSVDVNPIVMDLMGCVQALTKRIEAMEAEIAELKSNK
ncbi:putative fiber protein [Escherichia phage LAMP]|uniref:Putative fiber protein n=1 Tax=Escherichia phage LAMP TaxID=2065191 RepID=A0A2I6PD00_9CAUD|nr:putative fiber protein [Escherichia phage LAMP]